MQAPRRSPPPWTEAPCRGSTLKALQLMGTAIGKAGLVALAPALRRRSVLPGASQPLILNLFHNPFGDEGLAAL